MLDRYSLVALLGLLAGNPVFLSSDAKAVPSEAVSTPDLQGTITQANKTNSLTIEAGNLVRRALQSESNGETATRNKLLTQALQLDPDCAPANWHSGHVLHQNRWTAVSEAQQKTADDPRLTEYEQLRDQYDGTLEGELNLARWCKRRGLEHQQRYHWYRVLTRYPEHQEAQQAMGVRLVDGRLLTIEEIEFQKRQKKKQHRLTKRLKPRIRRWLREWKRGDPAQQKAVLAEIGQFDQPLVIPLVERELSGRYREVSLAIVTALSRVVDRRATLCLMRHAVLSPFPKVRWEATDRLAERPMHEYVPTLMGQLRPPLESEYVINPRSDGSVFYTHEVYEKGPEQNRIQTLRGNFWQVGDNRNFVKHTRYFQENGEIEVLFRPLSRAEILAREQEKRRRAMVRSRSYLAHAASLEQNLALVNQTREEQNERIIAVLGRVTNQYLVDNPQDWWVWWRDYNELAPYEIPTHEQSYNDSQYDQCAYYDRYSTVPPKPSCFPHGTPVWTMTGQKGIESVREGDWILAQNPDTGHLAFKPVLGLTFREPSPLIEITTEGHALRTTLGHPFWVNGKGWKMAKLLKSGDILHTVRGPVCIERVAQIEQEEAYNLIVGDFGTFFVGEVGLLVHDNTIRQPTQAIVPGLAGAL